MSIKTKSVAADNLLYYARSNCCKADNMEIYDDYVGEGYTIPPPLLKE